MPQVLWQTSTKLSSLLVLILLAMQADEYCETQWGDKRMSKAATEVLKNLEDGTHDSQIAEWLGLILDSSAPVTQARKRKRPNSTANEGEPANAFKPKANTGITVETITAANKGKHYGIVWQAWWKKYAVSLLNPAKQVEEIPAGDIANFVFPEETHYVATGNAADKGDWDRIMTAAREKGLITDDSEVVLFGSPPWGALESNRSSYLIKAEASASEYKDVELTETQIASFGSHAKDSTPERAVMILHLPPLDLGRYAMILGQNGWKVQFLVNTSLSINLCVLQATRTPITIVSRPGQKVILFFVD